MVCFLAFYLQTLFRKVLREKEPKTSYYDIIKELARVAVVQLEIAKKKYLVRTEIRGLAALAFKIVGKQIPAHVIELPS
ncbi:MAG: hypothetical protein ACOY3J_09820 [Bacillota bacterium]